MAESKPRPVPWRFFMWTAILAGFGGGGVYLADHFVLEPQRQAQRALEEKQRQIDALEKRRKELEGFVKNLKHTERRGQVWVLDQQKGADGQTMTTVRFVELDPEGNPIHDYNDINLPGDEIYVDAFVIKFQDEFVEGGDALKGKSLLLFRRIFSSQLQPESGYALDKKGEAPLVYASKEGASELEKELWNKFWQIPDDPELRKKHGVRAAQSTAAGVKVKKNDLLTVEVRATGEVTVTKGPPVERKEPANGKPDEPAAPPSQSNP